jgi:hypothetical protein
MHARDKGPENWLENVDYKFDNKIIDQALAQMTPEKSPVILESRSFLGRRDLKTEFWTQTKYSVENNDQLYKETRNWPESFALPESNPYVSKRLEAKEDPSRMWDELRKLDKAQNGDLWFKVFL